jgi:hypothetical protein
MRTINGRNAMRGRSTARSHLPWRKGPSASSPLSRGNMGRVDMQLTMVLLLGAHRFSLLLFRFSPLLFRGRIVVRNVVSLLAAHSARLSARLGESIEAGPACSSGACLDRISRPTEL